MSLLRSALAAVSKMLGMTTPKDERDKRKPTDPNIPEGIRKQRERAARAKPRVASRMARAWVIVRGGWMIQRGRLDAGQRQALRTVWVRRGLRKRTRLLGDGLAWRTIEAGLQGRTRRPYSAGYKRRHRSMQAAALGDLFTVVVDAPAPPGV